MILRAVNHKLRQSILEMLKEKKRMNVTDIYVALRIKQGAASQHLVVMRQANIVTAERERKNIYYSLNPERIKEVARLVSNLTSQNQ